MPPYIETFTGRRFYPLNPDRSDICIEDIAHALSRQCRFAGHVREFYSVAEHSYWVSTLIADMGGDVETQLWGLLHDASEAYLVDLPTPLKSGEFGTAYRAAEKKLMFEVCKRFDLMEAMPHFVEQADAILLATEARQYMPFRKENWTNLAASIEGGIPRLGNIEYVEQAFLRHYRELEKKR